MEPLEIRSGLVIPAADLTASFSRASGPGGQNVNKVETRATLRFALASSVALSPEVKARVERLARGRVTQDGELVLTSQRYRTQARNLEECRARLRRLIERALTPPRPRRPTKPSRAAVEERLRAKARQRQRKRERRGAGDQAEDS